MSVRDLQRRASALRTVSRSEARHLLRQTGAPFLHAGNERYVDLLTVVGELGVDDTVALSRDRRSLLNWADYTPAVLMTLQVMIVTGAPMLSAEEYDWLKRRMNAGPLGNVPVPANAGDTGHLLGQVLDDYVRYTLAQNALDAGAVQTVRPEEIRRLLDVAAMVMAVAALSVDGDAGLSPWQLRWNVSVLLSGARRHFENPDRMFCVNEDGSRSFKLQLV